ncbi:hypothetical protein Anapl_07766 [Anas platyrhynchos]|uniref:Uncharacterized protein n=1 Tax=Anas platyrhynchos TaxID=8839 RepID=R0JCM0_ANAPL|nr:hypothetical protein Anapl_07766 [Anas platyrhynchos]
MTIIEVEKMKRKEELLIPSVILGLFTAELRTHYSHFAINMLIALNRRLNCPTKVLTAPGAQCERSTMCPNLFSSASRKPALRADPHSHTSLVYSGEGRNAVNNAQGVNNKEVSSDLYVISDLTDFTTQKSLFLVFQKVALVIANDYLKSGNSNKKQSTKTFTPSTLFLLYAFRTDCHLVPQMFSRLNRNSGSVASSSEDSTNRKQEGATYVLQGIVETPPAKARGGAALRQRLTSEQHSAKQARRNALPPHLSLSFTFIFKQGSAAGQGSASRRPWHLMGTDVGRSRSPLPVRERSRAVAIPAPQPAVLLGWEGEADTQVSATEVSGNSCSSSTILTSVLKKFHVEISAKSGALKHLNEDAGQAQNIP